MWSLFRPICAELPGYKRMLPWLAVLAWRQRCLIALCAVAPKCSATASAFFGSCVCPPAAASGSSHGVVWAGWPVERQKRPDGWTSTPRAGSGAAAETTPGSLVCFWFGCLEDVGIAGFEGSYGTVFSCALVVPYYVHACRQPRLPSCSSKRQLARPFPGY